jgi:arginase
VPDRDRKLAMIGAPLDLGAGRRGVDMGPSAIRYAGIDDRLRELGYDCADWGNVETAIPEATAEGDPKARFLAEIKRSCERVAERVGDAAKQGRRPIVLGGDHSVALGTLGGLARVHGPGAALWLDAHGDLNTPETSPSGNPWGMPLRMLLDSGTVSPEDTVLVGARNLDPPEKEFIAATGLRCGDTELADALEGVDAVYVAFDCDVLDPDDEVVSFMPEPGGLTLVEALSIVKEVASAKPIAGVGFTGLAPDPVNVPALTRVCGALGL